ncbi:hypothetical protein B5M42_020015 [Paenibacillus athensensis]|uniref:Uncharacterized protein n=1 Tax=Paenibacillus athensensis TaxID=1967502 RepID=A0A4Y8Q081_9BACL|nr:hypothetical protein [Paenibacillus athensensis]MCD1261094.1 hypothetical protein [Paenibacillus athensensis]
MGEHREHREDKEARLAPDRAVVVWESAVRERSTSRQPEEQGGVTELEAYRQSKTGEHASEEAFVTTWSIGTGTQQREPIKLIMVSSGFSTRKRTEPLRENSGPQAALCLAA